MAQRTISLSNHKGTCTNFWMVSGRKILGIRCTFGETFWDWGLTFRETFWDWGLILSKVLGMLRFEIRKILRLFCCENIGRKLHAYSGIGSQKTSPTFSDCVMTKVLAAHNLIWPNNEVPLGANKWCAGEVRPPPPAKWPFKHGFSFFTHRVFLTFEFYDILQSRFSQHGYVQRIVQYLYQQVGLTLRQLFHC